MDINLQFKELCSQMEVLPYKNDIFIFLECGGREGVD